MGIYHSDHVAYGVKVELPPHMDPWEGFMEESWTHSATAPLRAGAYDADDFFLLIKETWKTVTPGQPRCIEPYRAGDEPYISWDAQLVAAAEDAKLTILTPPAWMFIPDEG